MKSGGAEKGVLADALLSTNQIALCTTGQEFSPNIAHDATTHAIPDQENFPNKAMRIISNPKVIYTCADIVRHWLMPYARPALCLHITGPHRFLDVVPGQRGLAQPAHL
jgi:hypothetical protein